MKKTEKIEVRLDFEQKQRLQAIAEARGLTLTELSRQALVEVWDGRGVPLSPRKRPPVHMLPPRKRRFVLFALISLNTGLLVVIAVMTGLILGAVL